MSKKINRKSKRIGSRKTKPGSLHPVKPRLEIQINCIPEETIEAFGAKHKLVMQVNKRSVDAYARDRFYAFFKNVEVAEGAFLRSTFGNGMTPEEAIASYRPKLSMKTIVVNAMSKDRLEINVPRLVA